MSGTTDRLDLPYPDGADGPDGADVPYWIQGLAVALDGAALDDQGILADRPVSTGGSPGIKGRYYMVKGDPDTTQNGVLWRDNGTGWDRVGILQSSDPDQGLGYATGAGGSVTQATSKSTSVTLDKPTGIVTMHAAALAAGASVTFAVHNSKLAADDLVIANPVGTVAAAGNYRVEVAWATVNVGLGTQTIGIRVTNVSGGSLSQALAVKFAIIKGAES